jgi:hypothetical protein
VGAWDGSLYGIFGGALAELLRLFRLRHQVRKPAFLKTWHYWLTTLGMTLAVVYLTSGNALSPILAVNIGASAPLIIAALVAQTSPAIDAKKID